MLVSEFIGELSSITHRTNVRRWLTNQTGATCPITAVCKRLTNAQFSVSDYEKAAKKIGLRFRDAERIATAADDKEATGNTRRLRNKLLRAVKLPEGI